MSETDLSPPPVLRSAPVRVHRAMSRDQADGLPVVGTDTSSKLGARPGVDITVLAGVVSPDGTGMSVVPAWRDLAATRIPRRLRHLVPGAQGSNATACYAYGVGPFQATAISDDLVLVPDAGPLPVTRGVIAPSQTMPEVQYNGALAATRAGWVIDEA